MYVAKISANFRPRKIKHPYQACWMHVALPPLAEKLSFPRLWIVPQNHFVYINLRKGLKIFRSSTHKISSPSYASLIFFFFLKNYRRINHNPNDIDITS